MSELPPCSKCEIKKVKGAKERSHCVDCMLKIMATFRKK